MVGGGLVNTNKHYFVDLLLRLQSNSKWKRLKILSLNINNKDQLVKLKDFVDFKAYKHFSR